MAAISSTTLGVVVRLLRASGNIEAANRIESLPGYPANVQPEEVIPSLNLAIDGQGDSGQYRMILNSLRNGLLQSGGETIRPMDFLRSMFTPGGAEFSGLRASELGTYFDPNDPAYMSANIMRTRGIEPGQGNEMADFLQQNAANLFRQSDVYNTFAGGTPAARPGQQAGNEGLARSLYGVGDGTVDPSGAGTPGQGMMFPFKAGATSYFNPTQGRNFLQGLNTMMKTGTDLDLAQETQKQRFIDDPNQGWQTMFDSLGGSLSPLLRSSGLQQRTNQRMQDKWRSQGTSNGGQAYLDFLTGMYAR